MKTGLVLSGGGARGFAHIGVLKALEEFGITPACISGTSAGSGIGALYASGYAPDEIKEILTQNNFFRWNDFALSKSGLLKTSSNEKVLRKYLAHGTIESLKIPLFIAATDIMNAEVEIFSTGDIVNAILASSAIPVLFEPVKYNGKLFIDGGAINCFPVEPLIGKSDAIIGIYVNPVKPTLKQMDMMQVFDRGFHLALYGEIQKKKKFCTVFIEPPELQNYSMFDFKNADEIIELGYRETIRLKDELIKLK